MEGPCRQLDAIQPQFQWPAAVAGNAFSMAVGEGQSAIGEFHQQRPVGQAGKGIMQGAVADRLLIAVPLAHVLEHAHVVEIGRAHV